MKRRSIAGLVLLLIAVICFAAAGLLWPGVKQLKATLAAELAATPTPSPDTRSMMAVTPDPRLTPGPTALLLRSGSKGGSVREAQERLISLGYLAGGADGSFGPGTQEAVIRFQKQNGLEADGVLGQSTWNALFAESAPAAAPTPSPTPENALLKKGDKGENVKRLQARLSELGYLEGAADGSFGPGTEEAVRRFQRQTGLKVDGVAGKGTQSALFAQDAPRAQAAQTPDPNALPVLVNRTHPVEESYAPADLALAANVLPASLCKVKGSAIEGDRTALEALKAMLEAAKADGVSGWQLNAGYRSWSYQKKLFDNSVSDYMNRGFSRSKAQSATRQTVADPGTSEHHTGLAFDVTAAGASQFLGTAQQKWLKAHCWDWGFVIRYTEEKEKITGYLAECWHIRYVGLPHSRIMLEKNQCLEEYLGILD